MSVFEPPGYCPNCGDFVEEGEEACPSCGSCGRTGWAEESDYDALDLPALDLESEEPRPAMSAWSFIKLLLVVGLVVLLVYALLF